MALQLDTLTAKVDAAAAKLGSVDQLQSDLKAAQDALAQAQADAASDQAKIDALAAKL